MSSLFTKIVQGETLPIRWLKMSIIMLFWILHPCKRDHTLVVPKREEDYIFDLTDKELAGLMVFAKKVAKAIRECVPCKRVGVAVLGLDVPHAHIHLVPLKEGNELNFANPKKQYSKEEMEACAELIRRYFKN